jgi:diacylglycerol kinase (ATP)
MPAAIETDTRTIALIANPDARGCDPELCAARLREWGVEVEIFGIGEVDRAVGAGADRMALAGGDGSIAPVAAAAGRAGVPLALIPAGTANDFARRLGLPLELSAACELAVRGSRLRALELGWMEPLDEASRDGVAKRPFVNVASAGLPAPAAAAAKSWKRRLGPLAYAAGAVAAGLTASPVPCRVKCDDRLLFDGEAWQITVAASGAFGAGSRIDEADPTDGVLDVVAVEAGLRPALVALAYRLRTGAVSGHARAAHGRCRVAAVHLPPAAELNVDGEIVRYAGARFTAERAAFLLVTG